MTLKIGTMNSSVIDCLRELKPQLQPACQKMVFQLQRDASYDYRADKTLHQACQSEVERLCATVEPGEGRVQACLVGGDLPGGGVRPSLHTSAFGPGLQMCNTRPMCCMHCLQLHCEQRSCQH